jgi:hypothetical protein
MLLALVGDNAALDERADELVAGSRGLHRNRSPFSALQGERKGPAKREDEAGGAANQLGRPPHPTLSPGHRGRGQKKGSLELGRRKGSRLGPLRQPCPLGAVALDALKIAIVA